MADELLAGWGFPTGSARKEHWFAAGSLRTGCGRYGRVLYVLVRPDKPRLRKFVCYDCERAAAKAAEAGQ